MCPAAMFRWSTPHRGTPLWLRVTTRRRLFFPFSENGAFEIINVFVYIGTRSVPRRRDRATTGS